MNTTLGVGVIAFGAILFSGGITSKDNKYVVIGVIVAIIGVVLWTHAV